jgi:hypothetical protein
VFGGQCPNCGGNLVARPRGPAAMLATCAASTERTLREAPCGARAAE